MYIMQRSTETPIYPGIFGFEFVVKLQARFLDQELTLFYPCHNNKKNKNKNPSPKSIRRGSVIRLKFDTQTNHGLLAEYRGFGVRLTHVTRRTRTSRRTPPKSTITEPTNNLLVTHRWCLPKKFLDQKFFCDQKFFRSLNFF